MLAVGLLLATHTAVQGGTLVLRLTEAQCAGDVRAFGRSYDCRPDDAIVVGVDLLRKPGTYPVTAGGTTVAAIAVTPRPHRTRRMPPRTCRLPASECAARDARVAADRERIRAALDSGPRIHTHRFPAGRAFTRPVPGDVTAPFGDHRLYGNVPGWHRGTDMRAAVGTPVTVASYGAVVLADEFLLEGKMAVVYHGSGIYTLYAHLDRLLVQRGQVVHTDDPIGTSGATGAAEGPHLHYGVYVNGAVVDPMDFAAAFNASLAPEQAAPPSTPSPKRPNRPLWALRPTPPGRPFPFHTRLSVLQYASSGD